MIPTFSFYLTVISDIGVNEVQTEIYIYKCKIFAIAIFGRRVLQRYSQIKLHGLPIKHRVYEFTSSSENSQLCIVNLSVGFYEPFSVLTAN